jgi:hypothetical protein
MPGFWMTAARGGLVRYYIAASANVAVDVLDAHGRVLKTVRNAMQPAGWHAVQAVSKGNVTSNGVYFVRCAVDGKSMSVKRILLIR